jgi:NDP-sugar pyrophosphorylase family protein
MGALTRDTPKSLLVVHGRPFVEWQVEALASSGFQDLVFCTGHLGEAIAAHLGSGDRFGVRIRYSDEGSQRLGTGGALLNAVRLLEPEFIVTYGDSYLPFDYAAPLKRLREHQDCSAVMSVYPNRGRWDSSNVRTDGAWVLEYLKNSSDPRFDHIDYGAVALRKTDFERTAPSGSFGLEIVQHRLAASRQMRAFVARERFFEIGSLTGLADLEGYLRSAALKTAPSGD